MSTHAAIVVKMKDGSYQGIYVHHDGYRDGVGRTLIENYNDQKKAEALVALGDLSSLAPLLAPTSAHTYDNPQKDVTVAYHRDQGEAWIFVKTKTGPTVRAVVDEIDCHDENVYIFLGDGKGWYCKGAPLKRSR